MTRRPKDTAMSIVRDCAERGCPWEAIEMKCMMKYGTAIGKMQAENIKFSKALCNLALSALSQQSPSDERVERVTQAERPEIEQFFMKKGGTDFNGYVEAWKSYATAKENEVEVLQALRRADAVVIKDIPIIEASREAIIKERDTLEQRLAEKEKP